MCKEGKVLYPTAGVCHACSTDTLGLFSNRPQEGKVPGDGVKPAWWSTVVSIGKPVTTTRCCHWYALGPMAASGSLPVVRLSILLFLSSLLLKSSKPHSIRLGTCDFADWVCGMYTYSLVLLHRMQVGACGLAFKLDVACLSSNTIQTVSPGVVRFHCSQSSAWSNFSLRCSAYFDQTAFGTSVSPR